MTTDSASWDDAAGNMIVAISTKKNDASTGESPFFASIPLWGKSTDSKTETESGMNRLGKPVASVGAKSTDTRAMGSWADGRTQI